MAPMSDLNDSGDATAVEGAMGVVGGADEAVVVGATRLVPVDAHAPRAMANSSTVVRAGADLWRERGAAITTAPIPLRARCAVDRHESVLAVAAAAHVVSG